MTARIRRMASAQLSNWVRSRFGRNTRLSTSVTSKICTCCPQDSYLRSKRELEEIELQHTGAVDNMPSHACGYRFRHVVPCTLSSLALLALSAGTLVSDYTDIVTDIGQSFARQGPRQRANGKTGRFEFVD